MSGVTLRRLSSPAVVLGTKAAMGPLARQRPRCRRRPTFIGRSRFSRARSCQQTQVDTMTTSAERARVAPALFHPKPARRFPRRRNRPINPGGPSRTHRAYRWAWLGQNHRTPAPGSRSAPMGLGPCRLVDDPRGKPTSSLSEPERQSIVISAGSQLPADPGRSFILSHPGAKTISSSICCQPTGIAVPR